MQKMQSAMTRAQELETELANERLTVDKGPVKAIFDGKGEMLKLTIDKSVVDQDDIETLEDLIVSIVRDGFTQATELRNSRVQDLMPDLPQIPGLS